MRARSREVNIFNMSLIDILCGALGAFCFMTLVLLPYYKPPGSATDLHKEETQTQELLKEMGKLRETAKDSALAQQMADLMQKLEAQIKQLQGEVNQFAAQNQQLETEKDGLTKKNGEQARTISQRMPFQIVATTNPPQEIDLYVRDDVVSADKRSNPPFNPAQPHHRQYWTGDIYFWLANEGIASWLIRDSPAGVNYKVYVKLAAGPAGGRPASVGSTVIDGTGKFLPLANVILTPGRFWTLVGTLTGQPEGKVTFKEATQADRDAEWRSISGSAPPPQATPAAQPSSTTAMSAEQRRAWFEQVERLRKQAGPTASP